MENKRIEGLGWLYKTYLLIRDFVGMRDGKMGEEEIQSIICKLDAFDRELASMPPDQQVSPESLKKWENTLKEIDRKCGHRQAGVYKTARKELGQVKKARRKAIGPNGA